MACKRVKRIMLAALAALTLATGVPAMAATSSPASVPTATVQVGETATLYADGTIAIKVRSAASTIYNAYKVNDKVYRVYSIAPNSVGKKVKSLVVSSGVTTFKKNAFAKAKKLRTIYIQCDAGTTAADYTIQKGAFDEKLSKKCTIKVSTNMTRTQYKKLVKKLKKSGFTGTITRADA